MVGKEIDALGLRSRTGIAIATYFHHSNCSGFCTPFANRDTRFLNYVLYPVKIIIGFGREHPAEISDASLESFLYTKRL